MQRKMNNARRVVIPSEFFNELGLSQNQEMEITIEYGELCIKKFQPEDMQSKQFIGIVRCIDSFHRITIPAEYFQLLGIEPGEITLRMEKGTIKIH